MLCCCGLPCSDKCPFLYCCACGHARVRPARDATSQCPLIVGRDILLRGSGTAYLYAACSDTLVPSIHPTRLLHHRCTHMCEVRHHQHTKPATSPVWEAALPTAFVSCSSGCTLETYSKHPGACVLRPPPAPTCARRLGGQPRATSIDHNTSPRLPSRHSGRPHLCSLSPSRS